MPFSKRTQEGARIRPIPRTLIKTDQKIICEILCVTNSGLKMHLGKLKSEQVFILHDKAKIAVNVQGAIIYIPEN